MATPTRADSLARVLGRTHSCYAQRFNFRYGRSGRLWQNRFYSCPLGGTHLARAPAYVDSNPVRAGLWAAPRLSLVECRAHVERAGRDRCVDSLEWGELGLAADWTPVLERREQDAAELRATTYAGLPYGSLS